jgi:hypothetical protein
VSPVPGNLSAGHQLRSAALLIAAVAVSIAALRAGTVATADDRLRNAPDLPSPSSSCDADAASAARRAEQAARIADARMMRYPFAPEEGLRALASIAEARECSSLAGTSHVDSRLAERGAAYRTRIAADYHDHLTRLRHALASGDLPRAGEDVRYLRALLGERDAAFAAQLRAIELEIDARAPATGRGQP